MYPDKSSTLLRNHFECMSDWIIFKLHSHGIQVPSLSLHACASRVITAAIVSVDVTLELTSVFHPKSTSSNFSTLSPAVYLILVLLKVYKNFYLLQTFLW